MLGNSMNPAPPTYQPFLSRHWPWVICGSLAFVVFQFFGNATRGYIATDSVFYWWGSQWFDDAAETQHGILILGLSAALAIRNLRRAGTLESAPAPGCAAVLMAGGFFLHVVGYAAQQTRISAVAVLVFTLGLVVFARGRRAGWAALFPVGFLLLALPLKFPLLEFNLQVGVVRAVEWIAHAVDSEVVRSGTLLSDPEQRYFYDVTRGCSGIRSLVALTALTLLLSYLYLRPLWLRVVFTALTLPFAFIGNVVRIGSVVLAGEWWGQSAGQRVHDASGFSIYLVVLGLELAVIALIRRRRPGWIESSAQPVSVPPSSSSAPAGSPGRGWVVAAVAICAAFSIYAVHKLDALPVRSATGVRLEPDGLNPAELPSLIGSRWVAYAAPVTAAERAVLPPDTGYSRKNYVSIRDNRAQVFVSIVLSGRDRTSIHRPEYCLEGQGWTIRGRFQHAFALQGLAQGLPATVVRIEREVVSPEGVRAKVPGLLAYWFVSSEGTFGRYTEMLWQNSLDRLFEFRADRWAYVVAQTTALDSETAALQRLQDVVQGAWPEMKSAAAR